MEKSIIILISIASFLLFSTFSFAQKPVYEDGKYKGNYSFITVLVKIKNGKISNIRMLRHGGGGKKYARRVKPLIKRIVDKQSTKVDAVTGATISSGNLKKAVNEALRKACKENCTLLPSN